VELLAHTASDRAGQHALQLDRSFMYLHDPRSFISL
jgi:hypothetical protein